MLLLDSPPATKCRQIGRKKKSKDLEKGDVVRSSERMSGGEGAREVGRGRQQGRVMKGALGEMAKG